VEFLYNYAMYKYAKNGNMQFVGFGIARILWILAICKVGIARIFAYFSNLEFCGL